MHSSSNHVFTACLVLGLAACVEGQGDQFEPDTVLWCQADDEDEFELHFRENAFSDEPVLLNGDLVYPLEFCRADRSCVSDPVLVDFRSTDRLADEAWCSMDACFTVRSEEAVDSLVWVDAVHAETETESRFAVDRAGRVQRLEFLGRTYRPCTENP